MKRTMRKVGKRGVTLVEVLIVVAIMAAIAGAVTLVAVPEHNHAKVRVAAIGAATIREAAVAFREIDEGAAAGACPSVQNLVTARKLDRLRTDDPWGSEYKIVCEGEEVHVISPGRDRKHGTPDDVHEGMKPAELDAIAKL